MHFDLLFVNGSFFSAPYCKFIDGWVGVIGERIAALGKGKPFPEVTAEIRIVHGSTRRVLFFLLYSPPRQLFFRRFFCCSAAACMV